MQTFSAGRTLLASAGVALIGLSAQARPAPDGAGICETVARNASAATGVPLAVLRAISLTETGRKGANGFQPWPWTVNMEGEGVWFDTPDEARTYVYRNFKRGARSFDVGCFQINYKWHGQNFASLDQMMDPQANADYAARYLAELFAEKGDWTLAAGAYHSRTPEFAQRYAARFDRFLGKEVVATVAAGPADQQTAAGAGPGAGDIPDVPDYVLARLMGDPEADDPRVNTYPLLLASNAGGATSGGLGSLVPIAGVAASPRMFAERP